MRIDALANDVGIQELFDALPRDRQHEASRSSSAAAGMPRPIPAGQGCPLRLSRLSSGGGPAWVCSPSWVGRRRRRPGRREAAWL
jgi:hypothetical protein